MARIRTTGIVVSELEQRIVKEHEDDPDFMKFQVRLHGGATLCCVSLLLYFCCEGKNLIIYKPRAIFITKLAFSPASFILIVKHSKPILLGGRRGGAAE
jgi:hypothetical protein